MHLRILPFCDTKKCLNFVDYKWVLYYNRGAKLDIYQKKFTLSRKFKVDNSKFHAITITGKKLKRPN